MNDFKFWFLWVISDNKSDGFDKMLSKKISEVSDKSKSQSFFFLFLYLILLLTFFLYSLFKKASIFLSLNRIFLKEISLIEYISYKLVMSWVCYLILESDIKSFLAELILKDPFRTRSFYGILCKILFFR